MIGPRPKFVDSPYFVDEPDNWHLKPGAPPEVVREFNQFMKDTESPFVSSSNTNSSNMAGEAINSHWAAKIIKP